MESGVAEHDIIEPFIKADGTEAWARTSKAPLRDAEDNIVGVLGTYEDITEGKRSEEERKRLERIVQRTQRLDAIGTLAGGIAHNFNNLLMTILGNVSLMLLDLDSIHPHYELLKEIRNQVNNGSWLAKQLLGYARKGRYYVQTMDLNSMVRRVSQTIAVTRKQVVVHTDMEDDLLAIEADQSQIDQVLMNLCINAADAMPAGGDLVLKTENVTETEMTGTAYDAKPGNYVKLTVSDTGKGMDKETMERIFEPFFTTKEMGRGTGLGLASVYGIVKGHGGYIDVESEVGRGTTFTVYLPATEEKTEAAVEPSWEITSGSGTILLVDDEERVLLVGRRLLERLGYKVIEARSGQEAIDTYRDKKAEIGLVILDIIMPRMGGGEVYDWMKEINPAVRVLLSSGYDIDKEAKEILARGCDDFIQKPFDLQDLSQKIREVLDKK